MILDPLIQIPLASVAVTGEPDEYERARRADETISADARAQLVSDRAYTLQTKGLSQSKALRQAREEIAAELDVRQKFRSHDEEIQSALADRAREKQAQARHVARDLADDHAETN